MTHLKTALSSTKKLLASSLTFRLNSIQFLQMLIFFSLMDSVSQDRIDPEDY